MKVEIEIKGNGNGKEAEAMGEAEMMDEMKMAIIGKKLQKNLALTRKERTLLAQYLLKEEED